MASQACSGGRSISHRLPTPQALLDEWRDELSRKPLGMSETDACAILEIAPDADGHVAEEDLKQARHDKFVASVLVLKAPIATMNAETS